MDADGKVIIPLDVTGLLKQIEILKREKVEAVTVCLMNAYVNGEHEQAIRDILVREMPNIPVSISSEVLPEMYEYERALTTVSQEEVLVVSMMRLTHLSILLPVGGQFLHSTQCRNLSR